MSAARRRRAPEKPLHKQAIEFVQVHKGRDCFAPFTGQDWRAWKMFVYALGLYANADALGASMALTAMASAVLATQESVQRLFRAAIPAVLDWTDEPRVWNLVIERVDAVAYAFTTKRELREAVDEERINRLRLVPPPKRRFCLECGGELAGEMRDLASTLGTSVLCSIECFEKYAARQTMPATPVRPASSSTGVKTACSTCSDTGRVHLTTARGSTHAMPCPDCEVGANAQADAMKKNGGAR